MGQGCAFWAEADRGNFGPLLRGMEHWSEACWSEAWGFGPRHGPFWSEARSGNGPRDRLGVTVHYIAFFKQFIREVGFRVGSRVGSQLGFVFLISIFYEGWEGASSTGVYSFGVLPPCIPFCFSVSLTADTAAREASAHFDRSGAEVDLRIVLVQPGEAEYHALLAKVGDWEQNTLRMSVVGHDHVDDFADASGLIKCSSTL